MLARGLKGYSQGKESETPWWSDPEGAHVSEEQKAESLDQKRGCCGLYVLQEVPRAVPSLPPAGDREFKPVTL